MKNTLRQVFHSSKFLTGFLIFAAILLTMWIYPLFNPGNPLEMIGVGTFAQPGTYFSLYDATTTKTETLRLPDADEKRITNLVSDADRAAMIEWFGLMEIDVSEVDATDIDALLDLWLEHYDPSVKIKGMTQARRNFFKRLDKNLRQIVLKELVSATGTSIVIGLIAGTVATLIGLTLGLLAGYVGGLADDIIMFITNIFTVIPGFVLLILISYSIGQDQRGASVVAIVIGLTSWTWTARSVRSQVISLRNRDHVNLSKLSGHSLFRIILTDILPYIASYVVMAFILQVSSGILAEAQLSLLGLGPKTTVTPTLGLMMNWAMLYSAHTNGSWWAYFPVILTITLISFSLNLMNTGLDQVFNPTLRD